MVVFNYSTRELTTKVVYYGPGLCGKTTNLQFIYDHMPQGVRGKMLSLATKSDRTLFFDFLPIDLGQIQGMKTKVQLYTVPGQVFYNETRRLVLKGADGVVFVADSQENMVEANLDSLRNLEENLQAHGMGLADTPHVLQYNKQDLPNALSIDVLNDRLNRHNAPFYEAIATTGVGVQETLRHITKLVLLKLNDKYAREKGATPRTSAAVPASSEAAVVSSPAPHSPRVADVSSTPTLVNETIPPRPPAPRPAAPVAAPVAPAATAKPPAAPAPAARPAASAEPTRRPAPAAAVATLEPQDVLAVANFAAAPKPASDEDILGIQLPTERPGAAGRTIKIDRAQIAAAPEVVAAAKRAAAAEVSAASISAVAVDNSDPLFNEPGVEATRLRPGQPQEILIPLEVDSGTGVQRFRLTVRLEIGR